MNASGSWNNLSDGQSGFYFAVNSKSTTSFILTSYHWVAGSSAISITDGDGSPNFGIIDISVVW